MFAVSVVLLQMFCYLFCSPCCGSVNRSSLWCSKFPNHPKLVSFLTSDPVSVSWDRLGWFISIYACRKYVAIVRFYGQAFPRELCFRLGVIHLMWVFFCFGGGDIESVMYIAQLAQTFDVISYQTDFLILQMLYLYIGFKDHRFGVYSDLKLINFKSHHWSNIA